MLCRKIITLLVFFICGVCYSEELLRSSREPKFSKNELETMRSKAADGDMDAALKYGVYMVVDLYNEVEGIKYLEIAAEQNIPYAIYCIIAFTNYKTDYYYHKLRELAKINKEAKELLYSYEYE